MILTFKGHHFVEDTKPGEAPSGHHCQGCGMKAVLKPDGSAEFDDGSGVPIRIEAEVVLKMSGMARCRAESEPNP